MLGTMFMDEYMNMKTQFSDFWRSVTGQQSCVYEVYLNVQFKDHVGQTVSLNWLCVVGVVLRTECVTCIVKFHTLQHLRVNTCRL